MILYCQKSLVGRIATLALLSSTTKRYLVVSAAVLPPNKTVLDRMLSPTDLLHSPYVQLEHIKTPVQSTQDEARRLLQERATVAADDNSQRPLPFLAVMADRQLQGRGTQGRNWEGQGNRTGNLYLTICVPYEEISVQLTLLPLQIAVLVAERAAQIVDACASSSSQRPKVSVKWPNDVLIDDSKLSGTLIESEIVRDAATTSTTWFLIGIGVNIAYAPNLQQSPGKSGRPATCLQDYCPGLPPTTAAVFGSDLVQGLVNWIMDKSADSKEQREQLVIDRWRSFAEFGKQYEVRGQVKDEITGAHVGEKVTTVNIQHDGQLRVRGENGQERLLIADYLF